MKNKITILLLATSFHALSNEVNLTIEGAGQVNFGEQTCTENCTLSTQDGNVLLVPQASSGSEFVNWTAIIRSQNGHVLAKQGKDSSYLEASCAIQII